MSMEDNKNPLLDDEEKPLTKEQERAKKAADRKAARAKKKEEKKKNGTGLWASFKAFITRGNVVDMAIGVTVAGAFTAIVTAFTKGIISPIVALITGGVSLVDLKVVVREAVEEVVDEGGNVLVAAKPEVAFLWGALLQAIIDFLIIAAVLFLLLRVFTYVSNQSKRIREELERRARKDELEAAQAKAAEEAAQAKAEAEAKAALAAQEAAAVAAAAKEKEERAKREEDLLREIRDLLKNR